MDKKVNSKEKRTLREVLANTKNKEFKEPQTINENFREVYEDVMNENFSELYEDVMNDRFRKSNNHVVTDEIITLREILENTTNEEEMKQKIYHSTFAKLIFQLVALDDSDSEIIIKLTSDEIYNKFKKENSKRDEKENMKIIDSIIDSLLKEYKNGDDISEYFPDDLTKSDIDFMIEYCEKLYSDCMKKTITEMEKRITEMEKI